MSATCAVSHMGNKQKKRTRQAVHARAEVGPGLSSKSWTMWSTTDSISLTTLSLGEQV